MKTGQDNREDDKDEGRPTLLRPPARDPHKAAIESAVAVTELSALGPDIFTNTYAPWLPTGARGIFGGTVIGQSLAAAQQTVPGAFLAHSCHCYFLLAGSATVPIVYHVERVRDGRSYMTRTVQARQRGQCIFTVTVSFARAGAGAGAGGGNVVRHAAALPAGLAGPTAEWDAAEDGAASGVPGPLAVRTLAKQGMQGPLDGRRCRRWVRCKGRISEEGGRAAHLSALGYLSDSNLMNTVARIHELWPWAFAPEAVAGMPAAVRETIRQRLADEGMTDDDDSSNKDKDNDKGKGRGARVEDWFGRPRLGMLVSLDHSIYFHEPARVRADEWMYVEMESPWSGDGRGVVAMRVFAADGTLLASCMQEGVVRLADKARM